MFAPSNRLSGIGVDREKISERCAAAANAVDDRITDVRDHARSRGSYWRAAHHGPDDSRRSSKTPGGRAVFPLRSSRRSLIWKAGAIRRRRAGPDRRASCRSPEPPRALWAFEMVYRREYKISTEKKLVRQRKGASRRGRTVSRKIPYTVLVRDERMIPERAIPAAAQYLASLESRYGGRDWAVFAYHCGEGCAGEVRAIAQRAERLRRQALSGAGVLRSKPRT